ncbi:hypothetical protein [Bradyrhizobium sp. AS23.2]|uniref:hypothetical protein n=1 Tax=Bradyrhizobium sp. AS23.2 TaxID=1680155 RepID=UPI0014303B75|nr:hypothetical protein [Bradyrhizobium sp. AS23.2]
MTQAPYATVLEECRPLNLYRMLPRAGPGAATGFLKLGGAVLRENAWDSRLRELV